MRVVVTGGAGFVGANLCRALQERGTEVVAFDDLSTGSKENLAGVDAALIEASVLDADALDDAFAGADAVVHLAAVPSVPRSVVDPLTSHHANATGTLQVMEAARRAGSPHVIVASSSSVYGPRPELPSRETLRPDPASPYAVSKLATEAYAIAHARVHGMPVLALRFFNVFGPLQPPGHAYAAVIPSFLHAAFTGRPLPVHGDGTQSRDFTYIGSLTRAVVAALDRRVTCDSPVNLAFGTSTTLLALIEELRRVLGRELTCEFGPSRAGDVPRSQADTTLLRSLLPDLEPVPLVEGLEETARWFATLGLDAES